MISRLDGEEESQTSDRWQLPGGSFAGTKTKPAGPPHVGALQSGAFGFHGGSVGRVSEAGSRGRQMGLWSLNTSFPVLCGLGNFSDLPEPLG